MKDNFEAKEQAKEVEDIGYMLLHSPLPGELSGLTEQLEDLSPLQADALNAQFKWDSWKPTNDPNVEMSRNESGRITGLTFTPALFDTTARTHFLSIGIGKRDKTQDGQ